MTSNDFKRPQSTSKENSEKTKTKKILKVDLSKRELKLLNII